MTDSTIQQHTVRLADLEARLTRLTGDVEDLASLTTPEQAGAQPSADSSQVPDFPMPPVFTSSEDWTREYMTPIFQRPFGGDLRWCSSWQDHPEAVLRLEAMWRAWETLHVDEGLGLSRWLLHHFDPDFAVLTSRNGPFARCTLERHAA